MSQPITPDIAKYGSAKISNMFNQLQVLTLCGPDRVAKKVSGKKDHRHLPYQFPFAVLDSASHRHGRGACKTLLFCVVAMNTVADVDELSSKLMTQFTETAFLTHGGMHSAIIQVSA